MLLPINVSSDWYSTCEFDALFAIVLNSEIPELFAFTTARFVIFVEDDEGE